MNKVFLGVTGWAMAAGVAVSPSVAGDARSIVSHPDIPINPACAQQAVQETVTGMSRDKDFDHSKSRAIILDQYDNDTSYYLGKTVGETSLKLTAVYTSATEISFKSEVSRPDVTRYKASLTAKPENAGNLLITAGYQSKAHQGFLEFNSPAQQVSDLANKATQQAVKNYDGCILKMI